MNDKIKISSKTNYHIYALHEQDCNVVMKNKNGFISFFRTNNTLKNKDIVIIYQKERLKSGFFGVVQIGSEIEQNDNKIKIFQDVNMNRYYAKIMFRKAFSELINPETIVSLLNTDASGFKSGAAFKQKYVNRLNALVQLDVYGKKIMSHLLVKDEELIQITTTEESKQDEEKEEEEEEEEDVEEEVEEVKKPKRKSKKKKEEEEKVEEEEEKKEVKPGYIPIMVIPCKEFKLPEKNKEKYFVKHLRACRKCDTTNNNDGLELIPILEGNNIEIYELEEEKHYYFDPALEAYYSLENYEPPDLVVRPFARIIYINNGHEIYDKCLLVTICSDE